MWTGNPEIYKAVNKVDVLEFGKLIFLLLLEDILLGPCEREQALFIKGNPKAPPFLS